MMFTYRKSRFSSVLSKKPCYTGNFFHHLDNFLVLMACHGPSNQSRESKMNQISPIRVHFRILSIARRGKLVLEVDIIKLGYPGVLAVSHM